MARERLVEKVADDGPWLLAQLQTELGEHPHIGDIRGRGFFIGIEFVADREHKIPFAPEQQIFIQIRKQAFANGLICYPAGGNVDGQQGDVAILSPPYNATRAELEEILTKFVMTCRQVFAD